MQKPTKSREWLEAEYLKLARQTLGGSEIQRVTIRRLRPKGTGPNWKVADIIPQPALPDGVYQHYSREPPSGAFTVAVTTAIKRATRSKQ